MSDTPRSGPYWFPLGRWRSRTVRVRHDRAEHEVASYTSRGWLLGSSTSGWRHTTLTFRQERQPLPLPSPRFLVPLVAAVVLALVALTVTVVSHSNSAAGRASSAARALSSGDFVSLGSSLASNRGDVDFAYHFALEVSPRSLGDDIGQVAPEDGDRPFRPGVRTHQYALTLVDLAGALSLATHGQGTRALPSTWSTDFITAITNPVRLYGEADGFLDFDGKRRERQDTANRANLLLLLARGNWSPEFLRQATRAIHTLDVAKGDDAWPTAEPGEARYAPAPGGTYLTDGVVALLAALTATPRSSSWAFRDFLPGTTTVEGSDERIGRFTHFLLFEHEFPESENGRAVGSTSVLTALSSAIEAPDPRGSTIAAARVASIRDSLVLQGLAEEVAEQSDCSADPRTYPDCVIAAASAVFAWVRQWGQTVLAVLTFAGRFAPPPINVGVTVGAAAVNATWHVIEDDLSAAGVSLAAVMKGLPFARIRQAAPLVQAGSQMAQAPATVAQLRELARASRQWQLNNL